MYCETTNEIQVEVLPEFSRERSDQLKGIFFFSYAIRITNFSQKSAQLISRHWIITDGTGAVREVEGEGVVGEKPVIEPQGVFEYSSYCPLTTPTGNMRGSYLMKNPEGATFKVSIPLFFLRDLRSIQ